MAAMESRFTAPVLEMWAGYDKFWSHLQLRIEGKVMMQMIGANQNFEGNVEIWRDWNMATI